MPITRWIYYYMVKESSVLRLAIFAPNVLPVPALEGGAVEELTTYIIEGNEKEHKYDIDLYTIDNDGHLSNFNYKYTHIISIKYKKIRLREKVAKLLNRFLIRLPYGRIISDFSECLTQNYKRDYYDTVLAEDNREVFNSLVRKIHREKLVFHIHDDIYTPHDNLNILQKIIHPADLNMIKGLIHSSDKIITVSHYLENRFRKYGATDVVTLYNGIVKKNWQTCSSNRQQELKRKFSLSNKDVVFAFIGRFSVDKGIDRLLLSFRLLSKYPHLKLLIVGGNFLHSDAENKYTDKLKKIVNSMSPELKSRIIFTGYICHDKINEIYSIINGVVIPSKNEAFSIVALEAMTMGVPVIASDAGGLPEVLGNAAKIVKQGENFIDDLSKSIEVLYLNPELREVLALEGKKRSNKFPVNKMQYFNNFSKIVK